MPLVLNVTPRDADAPGYFDLELNLEGLQRKLRGEPSLNALARSLGEDQKSVIRTHTPGAYLDPRTGETSLNAGYDPDSDAGRVEALVWLHVHKEVTAHLRKSRHR